MAKQRVAILISGRGSNMVALAEQARSGVLADCAEVVVVASNKPEAAGLAKAQALGLETAALSAAGKRRSIFDAELLQLLERFAPDWIVLAGYMRILTPRVVRRYPGRIVNIHPADTREHQGLHGYDWAWENRLPSTRITVHVVDEGLDTGPILAQREVDLRGAQSLEEVERRGLAVEHGFYAEVLRDLFTGAPSASRSA
jgi:phosphoribosylglycinamide formyltransferase-1